MMEFVIKQNSNQLSEEGAMNLLNGVSQAEYLGAIYALLQDKEGNIWMGTRNEGIIKLVPQGKLNFQLKYYKANPADIFSLNCNFIFSLREDKQGRIWVGTLGGGLNQITKDANGNERFIHSGNKLSDYPSRFSRIKNICTIFVFNSLYINLHHHLSMVRSLQEMM